MKIRLPESTRNWLTVAGATIALIAFSMIVFLFTITTIWRETHVYLGIVIYIFLPAIMILGLLLIPLGMWIHSRRLRKMKPGEVPAWPIVDLNDPKHRNAFLIFAFGTMVFLFVSAVGSYEAYHYTESVEFCGKLCHQVMHPEYIAFQHFPHARIRCVDCHVGSGADWYVRSKLNGVHQVIAVLSGDYPRPIPTPIRSLRPARETCEQCHWPQKYYAYKLRKELHYRFDEENTPWVYELVMRIGSDLEARGLQEGIHWHNNPDVKIEYFARDPQRLEIPWVRYTNGKTGEVVIYEDEENPLKEGELDSTRIRVMDCMDCHNRPSHDFRTPVRFVNQAMAAGLIPTDLPEVKSFLVGLCEEEYTSADSARQALETEIRQFYEDSYPEIVEETPEKVEQAVAGFLQVYFQNIFPEMRARWSAYPNHIGHLDFDGCFRCHSDRHVSPDGEQTLTKDCNLCHFIIAQGPVEDLTLSRPENPLEFRHPDDEEDWKDGLCTDCHEGIEP